STDGHFRNAEQQLATAVGELETASTECTTQLERAEDAESELNTAIGAQQLLRVQLAGHVRAVSSLDEQLALLEPQMPLAAAALERVRATLAELARQLGEPAPAI